MEFLIAQGFKSGNSRSLIFGVFMSGPGLRKKIGHECEGKFHFYICMMVSYSLACHAGVKVSIPGSIH